MKKNILITSVLSMLVMVSCQHKHTHSEEADAHEGEEKAIQPKLLLVRSRLTRQA